MKGLLSGVLPGDLHSSVLLDLHTQRNAVISGIGTPLSKAFVLSDIIKKEQYNAYLYTVYHDTEILEFITALKMFSSDIEIEVFVKTEDAQQNQQEIIRFIENQKKKNILSLTTTAFLFQKIPLPTRLHHEMFLLKKGDRYLLREIYETLLRLGYRPSDDAYLLPGGYRMEGGSLSIYPIEGGCVYKVDLLDNVVDDLYVFSQDKREKITSIDSFLLYPTLFQNKEVSLIHYLGKKRLVISDELDLHEEESFDILRTYIEKKDSLSLLKMTSFPEETDKFEHLRYLSVMKYYTVSDFVNDVKERYIAGWKTVIMTKNKDEIATILEENDIEFSLSPSFFTINSRGVLLLQVDGESQLPRSFQNTSLKIDILTDREIFRVKKKGGIVEQKSVLDFITTLKPGDYVVHNDHGIGRFIGIDKKAVDGIIKEYIQIQYAGNDKLFIPTDQAGKISRFIAGGEDVEPKLTRLDSGEWAIINKKVKKEAEKIAKELLKLYAQRKLSKGFACTVDTKDQIIFEETFPYEETPGQMRAIKDVKEDMEKITPMDRLVCGDVGFGKTEVALRAAFKAVQNGKQVAFISPVTILTDQHYKTFKRRMSDFNVRIEMMSRFQSDREQKDILARLIKGEVDIVIGTHRLLQPDIHFKDLGLVIVDEEQKFGVKQKEAIKHYRCNVDILTMTATPIPRTLNMSLNKLRDITTITTAPPGRLPIITQVRKYSDHLIRDAILYEVYRKGQIYFLHNKVKTIESIADKLRILIPEARFVVAHGQMDNKLLEERVMKFKEGKYDVLVSSTIIENGIDLPNANTLIVNNADQFGLSQLYQLRGRVGRSRTQAFTYLLYAGQRLSLDAKKRLRAIVEASELGSGFQIAMKDLEIRGAGDILGAQQHGVIKSVGVSHFIRMLNQTVEDMKSGKYEEDVRIEENTTVELPLTSFIPETYISDYKEKIAIYQKMSSMDNFDELKELKQSMYDEYGSLPEEVRNLFKVLELKVFARESYIIGVRIVNYTLSEKYCELQMSKKVTPYQIMNLLQTSPSNTWMISGDKLKIKMKDLGLDWFVSIKKALQKLIEGENSKHVEGTMGKK